ncbi:hypothetical protein HZA57_08905 [Candidatus Poribacteria bacterium]|nr:hypothetical protein [Candidatus Poribacteria bacterium]
MTTHHDSHKWQFRELLSLYESGNRQEADHLFEKLLHIGTEIFDSLANFTIEEPNHPRLAILLDLLAKIGDLRAAPILIRFLDIPVLELRVHAAVGLGWLRARAALEKLDVLEGMDPEEEVRRECQLAIEEILHDFPRLRTLCKHHKPIALPRRPISLDNETVISRTTAPGGEERRRLAGLLPRMLALKYRAVPLGIGPGGVLGLAVRADLQTDPSDQLRRLTGHEVDLHGWPLPRIYERLLTFYEWGDDDWVQFHESVTPEARQEIRSIVLGNVLPNEPHPLLEDCTDSNEAVLSFLSICLQHRDASARVEHTGPDNELTITMTDRSGKPHDLAPPPDSLRVRFIRALRILAGIATSENAGIGEAKGCINLEGPNLDRKFAAIVTSTHAPDRDILTFEFLEPAVN